MLTLRRLFPRSLDLLHPLILRLDSRPLLLVLYLGPVAGASKLGDKRKASSAAFSGSSGKRRPAAGTESNPIDVTPLVTLPPLSGSGSSFASTIGSSAAGSSSASESEVVLRFPNQFGKSKIFKDPSCVEQMLLPGPRSVLEKRSLGELIDGAMDRSFEVAISALEEGATSAHSAPANQASAAGDEEQTQLE